MRRLQGLSEEVVEEVGQVQRRSSQPIDSLGQIGVYLVYYNGFDGLKSVQAQGLRKLSIGKVFSIVILGFVLDTAK